MELNTENKVKITVTDIFSMTWNVKGNMHVKKSNFRKKVQVKLLKVKNEMSEVEKKKKNHWIEVAVH